MQSKLSIIIKLLKTQRKIKFLNILKIFFLPLHDYLFKSKLGFKIFIDFTKDVDCRFYLDDFEKENLSFFQKIIRENFVILDVGANIGIYSIIAGKKVGKKGKIFAFEPADWAYERLKLNIEQNKLTNVHSIKSGVSNFNGHLPFYVCEDDSYNSLGSSPMMGTIGIKEIPVVTIDKFCKDNNLHIVDIIKVDTEGADYLVLQGAESLLKSENPPIIFCEYNKLITQGFNYNLKDFESYLDNIGYRLYEFNGSKLIKYCPESSNGYEIICFNNEHLQKSPFLSSLV